MVNGSLNDVGFLKTRWSSKQEPDCRIEMLSRKPWPVLENKRVCGWCRSVSEEDSDLTSRPGKSLTADSLLKKRFLRERLPLRSQGDECHEAH